MSLAEDLARDALLAAREGRCGGSDLAEALGEKPDGCARRFVYKKRGTPADYEEPGRTALLRQRGHDLEKIVVQRAAIKSPWRRFVRRPPRVHAAYEFAVANIDREILGDDRGVGVFDAKTATTWKFREIVRSGAPASHILQLSWYTWIRERSWGVLGYLCPDSWEYLEILLPRNDALVEAILPTIVTRMRQVEHGPLPDALDPFDKRCRRCPWRHTCHGAALPEDLLPESRDDDLSVDDDLAPIVADRQDAYALVEEAERTLEAVEDVLKERLGEREAVRAGAFKVYYRKQAGRVTTDLKRLAKDWPGAHHWITTTYKSTGAPFRSLRVYEPKRDEP